MAGAADLAQDGVESLARELSVRFAGRPTIRRAVLSVLNELADGWAAHPQGMTPHGYARLDAALGSTLQALRAVPPDRSEYTVDQLILAWEKVRDHLDWVG